MTVPQPPPALAAPASPFASWRADHAGLRAPDFDAAVDWYVKTLDFRLTHRWSHGPITFGFLALPADDGFRIELLGGPGAVQSPPDASLQDTLGLAGWHHLCLRVADLDATLDALKRRGVTVLAEPFPAPAWQARIAFFADPWGNVFELAQVAC